MGSDRPGGGGGGGGGGGARVPKEPSSPTTRPCFFSTGRTFPRADARSRCMAGRGGGGGGGGGAYLALTVVFFMATAFMLAGLRSAFFNSRRHAF